MLGLGGSFQPDSMPSRLPDVLGCRRTGLSQGNTQGASKTDENGLWGNLSLSIGVQKDHQHSQRRSMRLCDEKVGSRARFTAVGKEADELIDIPAHRRGVRCTRQDMRGEPSCQHRVANDAAFFSRRESRKLPGTSALAWSMTTVSGTTGGVAWPGPLSCPLSTRTARGIPC